MSQYSVCPDPSMFSDSDGWEYDEPEPEEPDDLPAQWDEPRKAICATTSPKSSACSPRLTRHPGHASHRDPGGQTDRARVYARAGGGGVIIRTHAAECSKK